MSGDSSVEKMYTGIDNLEVMLCARNYNRSLVKNILKNSTEKSRVVDFGAGNGYFAVEIRRSRPSLVCVEVDPQLSARLKESGLSICASLKAIPSGSCDFVYSLNVLEHIENDREIILDMSRCLSPNGSVYLYVPAFPMLYSGMDRKVGHLRRYKIHDFRRLIEGSGFKISSWGYRDSIGFFASLAFKVIGNKEGILSEKSVRFYDTFLFPMNRVFDFIFSRILGKNIEVVLEKT